MPQAHDQPAVVIAVLLLDSIPGALLIPKHHRFSRHHDSDRDGDRRAGRSIGDLRVRPYERRRRVLYYPAQSASSLVLYELGYLTAPEIFRFGVWMTLWAFVVVLLIALPYWAAVGATLRIL